VGRQKISIVFKVTVLGMCGAWGARKAREMVLGRAPSDPPPALRKFIEFISLIHKNFRRRLVKLPIFSDDALQRLTMPVMAIVGGKDVLIDSAATKRRLESNLPRVKVRYLPEAGHFIPRQTVPILEFLRGPVIIGRNERNDTTQEADSPREGRGLSV
jgi:pimeloyl-ACP methyl ester carboxylesterase